MIATIECACLSKVCHNKSGASNGSSRSCQAGNLYAASVDLHVIRVVAIAGHYLDPGRHVVALTDRGRRIRLVAVDDLCPVVVLHPVALAVRIVLDVDLLAARVEPANGSIDLRHLALLRPISHDAAEYVAKAAASADREQRAAHGENSYRPLNAPHLLLPNKVRGLYRQSGCR